MLFVSDSRPVRVLQSVGAMNHGGIEHFVMNVYRKIDRDLVQFDFVERVNDRCIFDDEIESLGGRIYRFQSPDKHPVSSMRFYRELFREHPEWQVVHEHRSTLSGFLCCLRAASYEHVRTRVAHAHNSALSAWYGGVGNAVEQITDIINKKMISGIATDYFACSDLAAQWLFPFEAGVSEKVRVIPNGIDAARFAFNARDRVEIRALYGIPENAFVIGHVGRFCQEKNQEFLIGLLKTIPAEMEGRLLLLGDGFLRDEIEKRASELGLRERVVFAGLQTETWKYYSAMDAFCMPSIHEGLPVSAVEAQASGLPLVLSENVSRDTDLGGVEAFLPINEGPDAWVKSLINCRKDADKRALGVKLVADAGFDIDVAAEELQNFYLRAGKVGNR